MYCVNLLKIFLRTQKIAVLKEAAKKSSSQSFTPKYFFENLSSLFPLNVSTEFHVFHENMIATEKIFNSIIWALSNLLLKFEKNDITANYIYIFFVWCR